MGAIFYQRFSSEFLLFFFLLRHSGRVFLKVDKCQGQMSLTVVGKCPRRLSRADAKTYITKIILVGLQHSHKSGRKKMTRAFQQSKKRSDFKVMEIL